MLYRLIAAVPVLALAASLSAQEPGNIELSVRSVNYANGQFKAVVALTNQGPARSAPLWVGVTLRKPRDRYGFDLPAQEIALGKTKSKVVTFSAAVGPGFVRYSAAAWGKKVPCSGESAPKRDGFYEDDREWRLRCDKWGFVLDQPLASNRMEDYDQWAPAAFVAIDPLRVRILNAGAGPQIFTDVQSRLAGELPAILGGRDELIDGGTATAQRDFVEILYRDAAQADLAAQLQRVVQQALPSARVEVRHWAESKDAFVVALGK